MVGRIVRVTFALIAVALAAALILTSGPAVGRELPNEDLVRRLDKALESCGVVAHSNRARTVREFFRTSYPNAEGWEAMTSEHRLVVEACRTQAELAGLMGQCPKTREASLGFEMGLYIGLIKVEKGTQAWKELEERIAKMRGDCQAEISSAAVRQ